MDHMKQNMTNDTILPFEILLNRTRIDKRKTFKELNNIQSSEIKNMRLRNNVNNNLIITNNRDDIDHIIEIKSEKKSPSFNLKIQRRSISATFQKDELNNVSIKKKEKKESLTARKYERAPKSLNNMNNYTTFKRDHFSEILKKIRGKEKHRTRFVKFAMKFKMFSQKIEVNEKNIMMIFQFWQELYIFSLLEEMEIKKIMAFEIYDYYFSEQKIKDIENIIKAKTIEELKKNVLSTKKNRVDNISFQHFDYIRKEIESEISIIVLQYAKEKHFSNLKADQVIPPKFNLESIVSHVYLNKGFVEEFVQFFLLFHLKWISTESLLLSLFELYHNITNQTHPASMKSSVIHIIEKWINICPHFWQKELSVQQKLLSLTTDKNLKFYWSTMFHTFNQKDFLCSKSVKKSYLKNKTWDTDPTNFILSNFANPQCVFDIAQQLTLLNVENFISINTIEFARWNLETSKDTSNFKNISKYVKNMNTFSEKITNEVSNHASEEDKIKCLEFFVMLAKQLLHLGNFNFLFCFQNCFNVFEKMFVQLDPLLQQFLQDYFVLMDPQNNFKNYRKKFSQFIKRGKPFLPVLPIHLKDVYYIFEHLENKKQDDISVDLETIVSLRDYTNLMTTLQDRWADNKLDYLPNLSKLLQNKFSFIL